MKTLRRQGGRPSTATLRSVSDAIVRKTGGHTMGGLRIDPKRLNDGEAAELVALVRQADTEDGLRLDTLKGSELRRLERLIERGADTPNAFAEAREMDQLRN